MCSVRFGFLVSFLLLHISVWAQQVTQTSPQPVRDPQALAVVQGAITAMGGTTAISQPQSWSFQGAMRGPIANDNVKYTITTQMEPVQLVITSRGTIKKTPRTQSFFVPVLLGRVLVNQLQDAAFSMSYKGSITVNSKPCTEVTFSISATQEMSPSDQIWYFDNATNLPVVVEFRLPAEVGGSISLPGIVYFADYRSVSGVMYPFLVGIPEPGGLPEVITLQSVASSGTAVAPEFNIVAGDTGR